MTRFWMCVLVGFIPAAALAQDTPPPPSRLWIVAGGGSGTLRGHCQDCPQDFPFRHGGALVGNAGYRVSPRVDVGVDLFWMQWRNESGRIRATAIDAVAQFRPWASKGFFVKGGAGMTFIRNWVRRSGRTRIIRRRSPWCSAAAGNSLRRDRSAAALQ